MKLSFSSCTRKPRYLGLLAAFFCIFAPVSKAELTQDQVEAAVRAALTTAPLNFSGAQINTVPWLVPSLQNYTIGEWLMYNFGQPMYNGNDSFYSLLRRLERLSGSASNELERITATLRDSLFDAATHDPYLGQFVFSESYDLYVHDRDLQAALLAALGNQTDSIQGAIDSGANNISGMLYDQATTLDRVAMDISEWFAAWRELRDESNDYDEQTEDVVDDAEADSETREEQVEEDVEEAYNYEGLPDPSYNYEPDVEPGDLEGQDIGLSGVSSAPDHSALVVMVSRAEAAGGPLPQVEVDFGRDAALVGGVDRLADFLAWLYRALGALFLSIKGVHMWRVCYAATLQAATGEDPVVQLSWNPF